MKFATFVKDGILRIGAVTSNEKYLFPLAGKRWLFLRAESMKMTAV